jgi:hypothetical protein
LKIHPTGWLVLVGIVGIGYLMYTKNGGQMPWGTERIANQVGPWPGAGPGVGAHPSEMMNQ